MASRNNPPCRYWVFTLNNYDDVSQPSDWFEEGSIKYITWQAEVGDSGTPHLQGYLVMKRNVRLSWLKTQYAPSAHWEQRKGTHQQARDYANKDARTDGPWTIGTHDEGGAGNGKRNDIAEMKKFIDGGVTEKQVMDKYYSNWLRYTGSINRHRMLVGSTQRDFITKTLVLYGPPGTGKSHYALNFCKGKSSYWLPRQSGQGQLWWDGYDGQEVVVIDDFDSSIPYTRMLRLCDKYPYAVQTRGSAKEFTSHYIIITSNKKFDDWYPNIQDKRALLRRLQGEFGELRLMDTAYADAVEAVHALSEPASASFPELSVLQTAEANRQRGIRPIMVDITDDDEEPLPIGTQRASMASTGMLKQEWSEDDEGEVIDLTNTDDENSEEAFDKASDELLSLQEQWMHLTGFKLGESEQWIETVAVDCAMPGSLGAPEYIADGGDDLEIWTRMVEIAEAILNAQDGDRERKKRKVIKRSNAMTRGGAFDDDEDF